MKTRDFIKDLKKEMKESSYSGTIERYVTMYEEGLETLPDLIRAISDLINEDYYAERKQDNV